MTLHGRVRIHDVKLFFLVLGCGGSVFLLPRLTEPQRRAERLISAAWGRTKLLECGGTEDWWQRSITEGLLRGSVTDKPAAGTHSSQLTSGILTFSWRKVFSTKENPNILDQCVWNKDVQNQGGNFGGSGTRCLIHACFKDSSGTQKWQRKLYL